jgi:predicted MFS family arabinose efflux permease
LKHIVLEKMSLVNFSCLFILYFIQAVPFGVQSRYLPLIMRQKGASLTSLGLYKLLLMPWVVKFFIASFLVDVYMTKRYWLFFSLILLSFGSFLLSFIENPTEIALCILFLNIASTIQDICVDWFAINSLEKEDLGIGNTIQVVGFKLGTLFSGGLLVYLIDYLNISLTFAIIGLMYLLSLILLKFSLFNKNHLDLSTQANDTNNENSMNALSFRERLILLHKSSATYWICFFLLIYKLGTIFSIILISNIDLF